MLACQPTTSGAVTGLRSRISPDSTCELRLPVSLPEPAWPPFCHLNTPREYKGAPSLAAFPLSLSPLFSSLSLLCRPSPTATCSQRCPAPLFCRPLLSGAGPPTLSWTAPRPSRFPPTSTMAVPDGHPPAHFPPPPPQLNYPAPTCP
jgi:hypothetical protein